VDAARIQQIADVGRRIREEREAAGMSIDKLADATKAVSRGALQKIETGQACCSLFLASRIAEVLDVTIDALVPIGPLDDEEEAAE